MYRLYTTVLFQITLILVCLEASTPKRIRRQIVFEDDERNNRPSSADCLTPDERPGRCIPLTSCSALRQTTNGYRLRRYLCGFEGDEPRVCCPMPRDRVAPTRRTTTTTTTMRPTPTRRRTPPPTRRPVVTTTTTRRPQPGNLQKPRFLPDKCGNTLFTKTRVVGGQEAEKNSWPWMAVVFIEKRNGAKSPDCGGALVTNRHVITAAHCVVNGRNTMSARQVSVRLGAHDLKNSREPGAVDVDVESVRRHEQFDSRTYRNDIAVLKLSRAVPFTDSISPVCLPYDSLRNDDLTSKTAYVIGFGTVEFNGPSSDVLMEAGFDIRSQEMCRRAYERELNITSVYLCAGTADGSKDSCQGDSGGPLTTIGGDGNSSRFYLVGIVSFGKLCAQPGYPGVYTRVTEFLDWLERNLAD